MARILSLHPRQAWALIRDFVDWLYDECAEPDGPTTPRERLIQAYLDDLTYPYLDHLDTPYSAKIAPVEERWP